MVRQRPESEIERDPMRFDETEGRTFSLNNACLKRNEFERGIETKRRESFVVSQRPRQLLETEIARQLTESARLEGTEGRAFSLNDAGSKRNDFGRGIETKRRESFVVSQRPRQLLETVIARQLSESARLDGAEGRAVI